MAINPLGFVAALTAFLTIWFGHVAVRRIEFRASSLRIPMSIFVSLGLLTEYCSLITGNVSIKTVLGIVGITLLFDAFELLRQQRRIRKGHAPANPQNSRHAAIMAEPHSHATTSDLLKREPLTNY